MSLRDSAAWTITKKSLQRYRFDFRRKGEVIRREGERIGKGGSSEVFRLDSGDCLVLCKQEKDLEKSIQVDIRRRDTTSPHLPDIEVVGTSRSGSDAFLMPEYEKLTSKHERAWAAFKEVAEAYETARVAAQKIIAKGNRAEPNLVLNQLLLDHLWMRVLEKEKAHDPNNAAERIAVREMKVLWSAVEIIIDTCSDWGAQWIMETPARRNMGVSKHGDLVFLDPVMERGMP